MYQYPGRFEEEKEDNVEGSSRGPEVTTDYPYKKLASKSNDIRLLTLQAGHFYDPLKVTICHTSLTHPSQENVCESKQARIRPAEMAKTLPAGWDFDVTMSSRYIFIKLGSELSTTWKHPDKSIDPSLYELQDDSLDVAEPKYEALSYTWGSAENPASILVETDQSSLATTISVTRSLEEALRYLRMAHKSRTLWVDAICINQKDEAERNEQVKRMAEIYTCAARVVIWLGPSFPGSTRALYTMEFIGQQIQVDGIAAQIYPDPDAFEPTWYQCRPNQLPYDDETYEDIFDLLRLPWFTRLWVFQEAQLTNQHAIIQCGRDYVSWKAFGRAGFHLYQSLPIKPGVAAVTHLALRAMDWPLDGMLWALNVKKCTDDRDRIYAVLGLLPQDLQRLITPQYSLSVGEVFQSTFLAHVKWSCRLNLLNVCYLASWQPDRPTWVPNLASTPGVGHTLGDQLCSGFSCCSATWVESQPNILVVSGVEGARVKSVSPVAGNMLASGLAPLGRLVREWQPESLEDNPDASKLLDGLVRTISNNQTTQNQREHQGSRLDQFESYLRILLRENRLDSREPSLFSFTTAVGSLWGRHLFVSESGIVGLGPPGSRPGDVVCVLLGFDSSLMLRPGPQGEFTVVGECFVPDFQGCEVLLGPLPAPWRIQKLHRGGKSRTYYVNGTTSEKTFQDPRLGRLEGWESLDLVPDGMSSTSTAVFRNVATGETVNYDPRLTAQGLEERGVDLRTFRLA